MAVYFRRYGDNEPNSQRRGQTAFLSYAGSKPG